MIHSISRSINVFIVAAFLITGMETGCKSKQNQVHQQPDWNTVQDTTQRIAIIQGGLKGPESVQYDADQDVYFISNFNGGGLDADSNGFISRARPDGTIDSLKFMTGTRQYPFHAGHGMDLIGDTLFVAGRSGIHAFNKNTGEHLYYTDFSNYNPEFLNDVSIGPDSALYITDSGHPVLYRMSGHQITQVTDSLAFPCNGIIYDPGSKKLVLAAWGDGNNTFLTWDPATKKQGKMGHGASSYYDGIEFVGDDFIVSSQADSSLQRIHGDSARVFVKLPGRPADIGLDTKRRRVAVPYVGLNRVDIWQLPK